jgi:hypothetical protein
MGLKDFIPFVAFSREPGIFNFRKDILFEAAAEDAVATICEEKSCCGRYRLPFRVVRLLKHDWDPSFHKRIAFKHEQEVRALRHDVADWRKASEDEAFRLPASYDLQWDPVKVIDEIIVHPQSAPAYCDTVRRAVGRVAPALADKVKRSDLVTEPVRY